MHDPSIPVGTVRRLGDRAVLVGVADAVAARELASGLTTLLTGEAEVVCGSATVMVHATDPDLELSSLEAVVDAARGEVARRGRSDERVGPGRIFTVPCRFDGPDLEEVAALAGCRPDDVVEQLTAGPLTAAVVGFSPGFAYLVGLPGPLQSVPRRPRPRPVVPAGSVAIANGQAAVYPTASPGGWHLVGRTGFPFFSALAPPYAALAPGDQVRFTVAEEGERVEPEPVVAPPWSPPPDARAVFEVVVPGLRAVLQDGGRRSVAAVGVPGAGPADPVSFDLANRVTGNAPGAGALELTGGGTRLRCVDKCHVTVVGAAPEVRVDGAPVPAGQLLPLGAGQVLEVGRQHGGWRSYVSVAGGFLGPEWFGSCASDELTGLGPGPLAARDVLRAGAWAPPLGDHLAAACVTDVDTSSPVGLRTVPGPHADLFDDDALHASRGVGLRGGGGIEPGRGPPAGRGGCAAPPEQARRGHTRLPGRGDRRRAGATRRRSGRAPARPRHAGRLPRAGGGGLGRSRSPRPVRTGDPRPAGARGSG